MVHHTAVQGNPKLARKSGQHTWTYLFDQNRYQVICKWRRKLLFHESYLFWSIGSFLYDFNTEKINKQVMPEPLRRCFSTYLYPVKIGASVSIPPLSTQAIQINIAKSISKAPKQKVEKKRVGCIYLYILSSSAK